MTVVLRRVNELMIRAAQPGELEEAVAIDDSASLLYAEWGIRLELATEHPFCRAERTRWSAAIREGCLFFAVPSAATQRPLGFAVVVDVDGAPYLDQLAVRSESMRRGIGRQLLAHALTWARDRASTDRHLWLTTYAHLPFNRAFYEAAGFSAVPESACGPGIRQHLVEQRRYLPLPEQRIAMRRRV